MDTSAQTVLDARRQRTIWLMVGGAASLVLPLVGILYIKMNETAPARPPDSSVMFDRRENGETKVNISQTVTIINPAGQAGSAILAPNASSVDFVKGGTNNIYFQEQEAAAPEVRKN